MSINDTRGFLQRNLSSPPYAISLAVRHVEPVLYHPTGGHFFTPRALALIDELMISRRESAQEFVHRLRLPVGQQPEQIMIFLAEPVPMAAHIREIRNSIDEIAMVSFAQTPEVPVRTLPPVGLLLIRDQSTFGELAVRSPIIQRLFRAFSGQPSGAIWAYFLARAETLRRERSSRRVRGRTLGH